MVHRNITQTTKMVNNLRSMADKVDHIGALLDADRNQPQGPIGPSPNLLMIHFQLQQLEAFRNETLHQAKKSDSGERETLVKWFEKLDKVGAEFEAWLWEIAGNVVEIARKGNGGAVVRLLKICEVEGREDEKVSCCTTVQENTDAEGSLGGGDEISTKSRHDRRLVSVQIDACQCSAYQELSA